MKSDRPKFIEPGILYTPTAIAEVFQVDVEWVKKNLIRNRACRYRKQGQVYAILGRWLVEWAESDHEPVANIEQIPVTPKPDDRRKAFIVTNAGKLDDRAKAFLALDERNSTDVAEYLGQRSTSINRQLNRGDFEAGESDTPEKRMIDTVSVIQQQLNRKPKR